MCLFKDEFLAAKIIKKHESMTFGAFFLLTYYIFLYLCKINKYI